MKLRAGKCKPLSHTGDPEADAVLHRYYAAKKLSKARNTPQWKLAAAAAGNRRLLIGGPLQG